MRTLLTLVATLCLCWTSPGMAAPRAQHAPKEALADGQSVTLEVTLLDGAKVKRVLLRLRSPGREYTDVRMDFIKDESFAITLAPGRVRPPGFDYYIEGALENGERIPLFRSAENPVRVLVSSTIKASHESGSRTNAPPKQKTP